MKKYIVKLVSPYRGIIFHEQTIEADRYQLATAGSYEPVPAWNFILNEEKVASFPIQNTIIEISK